MTTPKIPPNCRTCGNQLSRVEMAAILDRFAKLGKTEAELVAHALSLDPPGVCCTECVHEHVMSVAFDEEET